mmetsp:Transcript_28896/g.72704  ORF Transcript_28896/g.72704 Transcript_28896/m.72704 type:complete len:84 (+) Transcript_28896:290-541(+)
MAASRSVRQIYKELMYAARDFPGGSELIRRQAKPMFFKALHEKDEKKLAEYKKTCEYIVKEVEALNGLHKYRTLRKRYHPEEF